MGRTYSCPECGSKWKMIKNTDPGGDNNSCPVCPNDEIRPSMN